MMRLLITLFFVMCCTRLAAQKPFIRVTMPEEERSVVRSARQFIEGATCKGCVLKINGQEVKLYSTGAFVLPVELKYGDTTFVIEASGEKKTRERKEIRFTYNRPEAPQPVKDLTIESINISPAGNLKLAPGDRVKIRVKALPNCKVSLANGFRLREQPVKQAGIPGIYAGEYTVKENDNWLKGKFKIFIEDAEGTTLQGEAKVTVEYFAADVPTIVQTTGDLPYLRTSIGEDRLGSPRFGYLDSAVLLRVIGKTGSDYKVRLSKNTIAWIGDEHVKLLDDYNTIPESLTNSWRVWGDSTYDYVSVSLNEKLPYRSQQQLDPSRIVVDIYGAINNTNWITQVEGTQEIKDVDYEQVQEDVFRVTIWLKHKQHWGHSIYYNGKNLVVRVRRQPAQLTLSDMRIGLDAGHGGSNRGALSITGVYEKEFTLQIALKVKALLEQEGAEVVATRTREMDYNNNDRMRLFKKEMPNFLLSIHLNSAGDPLRVKGTSTYYKHIGFRPLSLAIYKRLLELGLREFGNIGNFNFILNAPTEYPNALVECMFVSNPEDEGLALDEAFQQRMAEKIVQGVKDWLAGIERR
jgi:N-acetylmuramoyl-L-alanine amidase